MNFRDTNPAEKNSLSFIFLLKFKAKQYSDLTSTTCSAGLEMGLFIHLNGSGPEAGAAL